eukprot:9624286-Heterocapsa_arctica.AAC.1
MGAALRPANVEELKTYAPSIIPEVAEALQKEAMDGTQQSAVNLPPIVEVWSNSPVTPSVLYPG